MRDHHMGFEVTAYEKSTSSVGIHKAKFLLLGNHDSCFETIAKKFVPILPIKWTISDHIAQPPELDVTPLKYILFEQ